MCVVPYIYRNTLEMLLKLMKLCELTGVILILIIIMRNNGEQALPRSGPGLMGPWLAP